MSQWNLFQIQRRTFRRSFVSLLTLAASIISFTIAARAHDGVRTRGTIVGQVSEPSGRPLDGVSVRIGRRGPSAVTDAGGRYALPGVRQRRRIIVDFKKTGFVPSQAIASLKLTDDDDDDDDDRRPGRRLPRITLNRTLLPAGAVQPLNTSATQTLTERGFKVTFPAGSIRATGTVDVTVTPIDVSTSELKAFPGDFNAVARNGRRVLLETFSLMNVSISQNGSNVELRPGARATLEFLLPANTPLRPGQTVPLWFYSERLGLWVEEGTGTVGQASDPGRLSVVGAVSHFSWWNVDQPIATQNCLTGVVRNPDGSPSAGASVLATGVDYNGSSFASTNDAGQYCINVKRGSTVSLQASTLSGVISSSSVTVAVPDQQATCAAGGPCVPAPALTLPTGTSCVSGDVRGAANNPVAGLTVSSTAGTFATTDVNGAFCMLAPTGSSVTLFAQGFPSTTVNTSGAGSCATGGCTPSPIRQVAGAVSCLQVQVFLADGRPADSARVEVFNSISGNLLASGTTDATGNLCINDLPINTDILVNASNTAGFIGSATANTGPGGGSCASGGCVPLVLSPVAAQ